MSSDHQTEQTEGLGMMVCGVCDWEGVPEAFEQFSIVSFGRNDRASIEVCNSCREDLSLQEVSDIAFE